MNSTYRIGYYGGTTMRLDKRMVKRLLTEAGWYYLHQGQIRRALCHFRQAWRVGL